MSAPHSHPVLLVKCHCGPLIFSPFKLVNQQISEDYFEYGNVIAYKNKLCIETGWSFADKSWICSITLSKMMVWFALNLLQGTFFIVKWWKKESKGSNDCIHFLCLMTQCQSSSVLFLGKNMWAPSLGIPSIRVTTWGISIRDEIWCPHSIGAGCWGLADLEADKVISAQQAQLSPTATCPLPTTLAYIL